jgi:hypothetical protein
LSGAGYELENRLLLSVNFLCSLDELMLEASFGSRSKTLTIVDAGFVSDFCQHSRGVHERRGLELEEVWRRYVGERGERGIVPPAPSANLFKSLGKPTAAGCSGK